MSCNHPNVFVTKYNTFCLSCGAALPLSTPSQWRTVDDMPPFGQPYYAAGPYIDAQERRWRVERITTPTLPHLATHWASDSLGLPE